MSIGHPVLPFLTQKTKNWTTLFFFGTFHLELDQSVKHQGPRTSAFRPEPFSLKTSKSDFSGLFPCLLSGETD